MHSDARVCNWDICWIVSCKTCETCFDKCPLTPAAEAFPNTQLNFNHKLLDWQPETGTMTFLG